VAAPWPRVTNLLTSAHATDGEELTRNGEPRGAATLKERPWVCGWVSRRKEAEMNIKSRRRLFVAVLLAGVLLVALWDYHISGPKSKLGGRANFHRTNRVDQTTPKARTNPATQTNPNFRLGESSMAGHIASANVAAQTLEKRRLGLERVATDTIALNELNRVLDAFANMNVLPPWIPRHVGAGDIRSANYSDHALGGYVRMATDYLPNVRVETLSGTMR
jgi:hypothetical protein